MTEFPLIMPSDNLVDIESGPTSGASSGTITTNTAPPQQSQEKIQKLQQHVADVSNIMTENINKILERGQRLDNLEGRSEMLSSRADEFRVTSRRVSRKMWWQNMKLNLIIGSVVVIIIIVIVIIVTNNK